MIIEQSRVSLRAEHESYEFTAVTNDLEATGSRLGGLANGSLFDELFADAQRNQDSGQNPDEDSQQSILVMTEEGLQFRETTNDDSEGKLQESYTQAKLFRALIEALTGRKLPLEQPSGCDCPEPVSEQDFSQGRIQRSTATDFLGQGFQVEMTVNVTQTQFEYEASSFMAEGTVKTADGQEIDLNLNLQMQRSYSSSLSYTTTQTVTFKDPLVLNFDGTAAELEDTEFEFDIDADGETEWINALVDSSGWLALDKNGDGKINDGSELFGALSGDGFADLAEYDEDQNGFIDEADAIYNDLLVWTKTAEQDELTGLKENDVGAIYLNSAATPFDLKDGENNTQGRVLSSSFYLTDSGEAGSIQQIDMAV